MQHRYPLAASTWRPWLAGLGLLLLTPLAARAQTGSVGIGTATPNGSAALDVQSTTKGLLPPRLSQTQRNAIASPANGLLIYQTDNNPGLYQYQTGSGWVRAGADDLGDHTATQPIGYTTNDADKIHFTQGGGANGPKLAHGTGWALDYYAGQNSANNGLHRFWTGTSTGWQERLRITQSGNVGIGLVNPSARLQVAGDLKLNAGAAVNEFSTDGTLAGNADTAVPTEKAVKTYVDAKVAAAAGDNLGSHTATQNLNLADKLLVGGTAAAPGTAGLRVLADGKVGIGTTAPVQLLDVSGPAATATVNTAPLLRLSRPTTSGVKYAHAAELHLGSYGTSIGSQSQLDFRLNNGNTNNPDRTVLTLLGNGNVGIGTTDPDTRLQVAGGVKVDGTNTLELGGDVSGKQTDAGKIGYQRFTANALDIVGAGTASYNRRIKLWAEGGLTVAGLDGTGTRTVVADASGTLSTVEPFAVRASNGLNTNGSEVALGGALAQPTTISQGLASLTFQQHLSAGSASADQVNTVASSNFFFQENAGGAVNWQSFTAGRSGALTRLDLRGAPVSEPSVAVTVRVYSGQGLGGQLLAVQTTTFNRPPCCSTPLTAVMFGAPPLLTAGQVYTFAYDVSGTTNFTATQNDSYPAGLSSYAAAGWSSSAGLDVEFVTYVAPVAAQPVSLLFLGGGKVGVGTNAPQEQLHVNGNLQLDYASIPRPGNDAGSAPLRINTATGKLQIAASARRYKENIRNLAFDRTRYLGLRPRAYNYKNGGAEMIGLIAEEVAPLMPDMVIYGAVDPSTGQRRTEGVDYERMGTYNLAVLQDHEKTIAEQAARIAALEAELKRLQSQLTGTASLEQRLKDLENLVGAKAAR